MGEEETEEIEGGRGQGPGTGPGPGTETGGRGPGPGPGGDVTGPTPERRTARGDVTETRTTPATLILTGLSSTCQHETCVLYSNIRFIPQHTELHIKLFLVLLV